MADLNRELAHILDYWSAIVFDAGRNRFYGQVDEENVPDDRAPLGSVMYSRILWSFSAAYRVTAHPRDLEMAGHAYTNLVKLFVDEVYGGVFWSVDAEGNPREDKKQVYALAFAIYGLTEYYAVTTDKNALDEAILLYRSIEKYSLDKQQDGYLEAFNRDWSPAANLRLSEKDDNERKTMNTHLHIMEAYVNLYRVWPDDALAAAIRNLVNLFTTRFVHNQSKHLILFFNEEWQARSEMVSYGHDIEASWLLCEAAEVLGDPQLIEKTRSLAPEIVNAALTGFEADGGLNYEYLPGPGRVVREKHWWVQAEAAVGLLNAWQITGLPEYRAAFARSWEFITSHIIDREQGEWVWGIGENGLPMPGQDKAGIWKCPYHNTRCLLEIMRRTGGSPGLVPPG